MNIVVRSRQFKITDALREYVIKRVKKLEKYPYDFSDVQVTLSVEKERQRVEITTALSGFALRGEEETLDMYSSVDLVVEKLERQINKYRKRFDKRHASIRDMELLPEEGAALPEVEPADSAKGASVSRRSQEKLPEHDTIVRVKKILTKPMSVEEAVMQMNMVGHSFYMFINAESGQMNVVYSRNDGNYGLLEPETGA